MTKFSLVLCTLLPLACSAPALAAQNAPEAAPGGAERHHHDAAAWHKEACSEHYARLAGHLGYLQARLSLSDQQTAAFEKWRQAVLEQNAREKTACLEAKPKADGRPTAPEREAHFEKMLTSQLQSLQATRPALEALYGSLSAEQRAVFDRDFLRAPHRHGPHMGPEVPMGGPHDEPMPDHRQ